MQKPTAAEVISIHVSNSGVHTISVSPVVSQKTENNFLIYSMQASLGREDTLTHASALKEGG